MKPGLARGIQPNSRGNLPLSYMAKILLVEDNEMSADMLSRRLSRRGYQVEVADDGQKAVDMTLEGRPDVVLMDMSLPVIDGWEATRRIRADERSEGIRIIALTAHALATERDKALAAGCDDYDTKPVDLQRLLAKIEAALGTPG